MDFPLVPRGGGSATRRAARTNGPASSAVHPGLPGGNYRPLSDADIQRIHATALDILENIGIGDPIAEILHHVLPKGCVLGDDNRLRFPRALVEDLIAQSANEYPLFAPDPKHDLTVRGQDVLFCTSGEAVTILDWPISSSTFTVLASRLSRRNTVKMFLFTI